MGISGGVGSFLQIENNLLGGLWYGSRALWLGFLRASRDLKINKLGVYSQDETVRYINKISVAFSFYFSHRGGSKNRTRNLDNLGYSQVGYLYDSAVTQTVRKEKEK